METEMQARGSGRGWLWLARQFIHVQQPEKRQPLTGTDDCLWKYVRIDLGLKR
jgi:hypothetical protein